MFFHGFSVLPRLKVGNCGCKYKRGNLNPNKRIVTPGPEGLNISTNSIKYAPSELGSPIASLPPQAMSSSASPTLAARSLEDHAGLVALIFLIVTILVFVTVVVTCFLSTRRQKRQERDNENPLPLGTMVVHQTAPVAQDPAAQTHENPVKGG